MKGSAIVASLAVLLSAVPLYAQAAGQPRPAQPTGQAPAQPRPAQPRPAQPSQPRPGQPAGPAQAPAPAPLPPPAPFIQGAKIAVVNLQVIAQNSVEGKAATTKIQALIQKKQQEGVAKTKALQDNQTKLEQSGALMNETARTALQKEIERQQVEGQRFEQDAQAEVNELQTELQNEFQKRLFPILQQLAREKELHVLLSAQESGAIWAEPGVDLTLEAIKRLDGSTTSTAAKPAAAPASPAPPDAPAPPPATPRQ